MDGLAALGELVDWPGSRVLLTGQADEQVAVRAFNRGLIDQFIAKQTADISRRLVEAVDHLLSTPNARHAQIWRATLSAEQNALLRVPSLGRDLGAFASKRWVEYVMIGDPFGVIGMDASGHVSWLQLETRDGLKAMAELAEIEGVPPRDRDELRHGRKLANLELRQAFGRNTPIQLNPAFTLGEEANVLGAVFDVDPAHSPDPANSYKNWLARQDKRSVQG
jgi:hypothetical protein